jgi:hypothetical protein
MLNRNFVVRRGRNNRLMVKLIEKEIFEEENSYDIEDDGKPILKKRPKTYYNSALDYIQRELPDFNTNQYCNLLRDKKFMYKRMKKTQTLFVKEAVNKMVKKSTKGTLDQNSFTL